MNQCWPPTFPPCTADKHYSRENLNQMHFSFKSSSNDNPMTVLESSHPEDSKTFPAQFDDVLAEIFQLVSFQKSFDQGGVHLKKKKVENFLNRGGSGQTFFIFSTFFYFLTCPNSCKYAKKKIFSQGGYPLLTTKTLTRLKVLKVAKKVS